MIHKFRNVSAPVKILLWFVIATFVGSIFVVWGIQSGDQRSRGYVIKVNDIEIGPNEFNRTYNQVHQNISALFGNQGDAEINRQIREIVIDNLISKALLLQEAQRRNLRVSDQELFNSIAAIEAFQEEGVFSRTLYRNVLEANKLSPAIFEEMQKESLLVEKIQNQIVAEVRITEDDLQEEFQWQQGRVAFDYIILFPELFADSVETNERVLRAYHETNAKQYETPKSIQISYAFVSYDPQDSSTQETASEVLQSLREAVVQQQKDFATTAEEMEVEFVTSYIFDQNSIPEDLLRETRLIREAFLMPQGRYTNVIRGQDKLYLVKKEQDIPPMVVPYEEIQDQVLADYIQHQSYVIAMEKAESFRGMELFAIAAEVNAQPESTDLISYMDTNGGPGFNEDVMYLAFLTEVGQTAGPAEIINIPFFLQVTEKETPDMELFESLRPLLMEEVRERRRNEMLSDWIVEARSRATINVNQSLFVD